MKAIGIICTVIVALQVVFTLFMIAALVALDEADHDDDAWDDALADLLTEEDQ